MAKIMEALDRYPERPPGRRKEVRAFVLTLRYTGLRIRDVTMLHRDKIVEDELLLSTQKTAAVVRLPLPKELVVALDLLPHNGTHYFWSGFGTPKSAVAAWERTLKGLFKLSGFHGTAHQFRHYLAKRLLMNGVSVQNVAAILGNSSRIVESTMRRGSQSGRICWARPCGRRSNCQ
jgi:integrase/recombinase XerD